MRTITLIFALLLIGTLLVPGAAADGPGDTPLFRLKGHITNPGTIDVFGPPGADLCGDLTLLKHVKIRGFTAAELGGVEFLSGPHTGEKGDFSYTENINVNTDQADCCDPEEWYPFSTEQGDMTLTFDMDGDGNFTDTIDVRFVGQADLKIIDACSLYVEVTVDNQPWNIKGGTGYFSNIHGNGTRSTCDAAPGEICVNYYGDIRF